jgi:hypothetical protein
LRALTHGGERAVSPFQPKYVDVLRARNEGVHGRTCLSEVFIDIAAAMVMSNDLPPR